MKLKIYIYGIWWKWKVYYTQYSTPCTEAKISPKWEKLKKDGKSIVWRKQRCDDAILSGNIYFNIKNVNFQTYIYSNAIAFLMCVHWIIKSSFLLLSHGSCFVYTSVYHHHKITRKHFFLLKIKVIKSIELCTACGMPIYLERDAHTLIGSMVFGFKFLWDCRRIKWYYS